MGGPQKLKKWKRRTTNLFTHRVVPMGLLQRITIVYKEIIELLIVRISYLKRVHL